MQIFKRYVSRFVTLVVVAFSLNMFTTAADAARCRFMSSSGTTCSESDNTCKNLTTCNGTSVTSWKTQPGGAVVLPGNVEQWVESSGEEDVQLTAITSSTKVTCLAGKYLSANATSSAGCTTCTAGYYCPGGSFTPSSSIQGRHSCPTVHPSSSSGSDAINDCYRSIPAGKEFDSTTSSNITCHCGGYCPGATMAYGTNIDSFGWAHCEAGNYCPAGSTAPTTCPKGHKCPENYLCSATACPAGTYQASTGATSCNTCANTKPANSTFGTASTSSNCPWTCNSGYTKNSAGTACNGNTITINYNENSGDTLTNGSCTYGSTFTLPTATRTGYKITNWTLADGTTATAGSSVSCNYTKLGVYSGTSTKVKANWALATYTITLDAKRYTSNTATSGTSATTNVSPTTVYLKYSTGWYSNSGATTSISSVTIPKLTGYTFGGFWTTKYSSGTQIIAAAGTINSGKTTTFSSNSTIYARWTANTYSISYTLNGGTAGSSAPTSATYNTTLTISNPTRTGYTFAGWNISGMDGVTHTYGSATTTATSISSTKATSFKNLRSTSGTVTFTAQWTPNVYAVTLNNQSATTAGTTSYYYQYNTKGKCYYYTDADLGTCIGGTSGDTITIPTRNGYMFAGYFTSTGGTGTQYVNSSGVTINNLHTAKASNTTLYAYWTACGTGYYCSGNVKTQCPNGGTTSTTTASAASSCYKTGLSYTATHGSGTQTCNYTSGSGTSAVYSTSCTNKIITSCHAGYYRDAAAATDCVEAGNGYYSASGSVDRIQCPFDSGERTVASSSTSDAATDCYAVCPSRTISNGTATIVDSVKYWNGSVYPSCTYNTNCNAGYYGSDGVTSPSCSICSSTTYSTGNATTCTACSNKPANSSYTSATGKTSASCAWNCNTGYTKNSAGTGCNANTYSISYTLNGGSYGASHPTTATYNTAFTVNAPTRTGYTFTGWGISGMDSVTHTYGSATTTATSITTTTATSFKNLRATSGTVTFTAQWSANKYKCASGQYLNLTTCADCPKGYYCPNGEYTYTYNGSLQGRSACATGTYNPNTKSTSSDACVTCPGGTYGTTNGQAACTTCPENYYCLGGTTKYECANYGTVPEGTDEYVRGLYPYSDAGASSTADCYFTTSAGKYVARQGSGEVDCAAGYYCPGGYKIYVASQGGAATGGNIKCVSGSISSAGASSCSACSGGKTASGNYCTGTCGNSTSYVKSWVAATWNSNNTVSNTCTIASCVDGYKVSGNACVPQTYTVTYNCGTGTGTPPANGTATYAPYSDPDATTLFYPATGTENTCTKTGYNFTNWAVSGTSDTHALGFKWNYLENKTFTAQWSPITYTIAYNKNKPSNASSEVAGTTANSTHTYDTAKNLTANGYSLTGWRFAGWATSASGNVAYADKASVKNLRSTSGTYNLYAKWNANTYTVNFNANGGSGTMSSQSRTYDDGVALTANAFTKTGYDFDGWSTTAGGALNFANKSTANVTATNGATVTLYARWKAKTYTCSAGQYLNKTACTNCIAGHYCPNASKTYTYNASVQGLSACPAGTYNPNTKSTSSDACITCPGGTYGTASGQTSVSACTTCPENYYCTGGSENNKHPCTDVAVATDDDYIRGLYPYSDAGASLSGYCYFTTSAGKYVARQGGGEVDCEAGYYCPGGYKIYYSIQGGTATGGNEKCVSGSISSAGASSCSACSGGKTANGNSCSGTCGNSTSYVKSWVAATWNSNNTVSNTCTIASCVDGYKVSGNACVPQTYTVTYNCGTGTGTPPANGTATYAPYSDPDATTLFYPATGTENTCTKTGYNFTNWAVSGTSDTHALGFKWNYLENKTFTAQWSPITYTIAYALNSGTSGGTQPASATYDTAFTISAPTRTGYTFAGWKITGMDGVTHTYGSATTTATSISSTKATSFKNLRSTSGTVTFTAQWTPNTYSISYALNSGTSGGTQPASATYDTAFTVSAPTRTGYTFAGWKITGMDGVTHTYGNATTTATSISNTKATSFKNLRSTSGTVTFTAQWTPNCYRVTLDPNFVHKDPSSGYVVDTPQEKTLWKKTGDATWYTDGNCIGEYNPADTDFSIMPEQYYLNPFDGDGKDPYTFRGYFEASNPIPDATASGTLDTTKQYIAKDGAITSYGANWIPTQDTTLYAAWASPCQNTPSTDFSSCNLNVSNDGNVNYITSCKAGYLYVDDSMGTYKPKCERISYFVKFEKNGGTGSMQNMARGYDDKVALTTNAFTRDGYIFSHWNTSADGNGTSYENGSTENLTTTNKATVTLYAQWSQIIYKITYNGNKPANASSSVSGTTQMSSIYYGDKLRANGFGLPGWTFQGWNTLANGTGTSFANEATIDSAFPFAPDPNNLENPNISFNSLYAQWQECGINSYCPGDNKSYECPDDGQTKTTTAKSVTECYKSGLSCSTTGGTGTRICDYNKETKLYNANCTECNVNACVVGTYLNGNKCETCPAGSYCPGDNKAYGCPSDSRTVTSPAGSSAATSCYVTCPTKTVSNGTVTTVNSTIKYNGSTYPVCTYNTSCNAGYYGADNTTSPSCSACTGATYSGANASSCTACPNGGSYFDANGNGAHDTVKECYKNVSWSVANGTGTQNCYYTSGSGTSAVYSGNDIAGCDTKVITSCNTGYSKNSAGTACNGNTTTVDYNANGGTGSMADKTFTYGVAQNLTTNAFDRTGYTFVGWNTASDGSGTDYDDKALISNLLEDITLYAQWSANCNKITVDDFCSPLDYAPTLYKKTDAPGWYSDSSCNTALTQVSLPDKCVTSKSYTFRGLYSTNVDDLTADGNTGTQYFTKSGDTTTAGTNWTVKAPQTIYVGWAADCDLSDTNATCSVSVGDTGAVDYTTSCKSGYTINSSTNNTYKPTCTGNTIIVDYNENGGTAITNGSCVYGDTLKLPSITRNGFTFKGWKLADDTIVPANSSVACTVEKLDATSDVATRIIAQWTTDGYAITYNLDGGANAESNPSSYTVESDTITLANPSKDGYTFGGWYDNEDLTGTAVTQIAAGSTGNKEFWAKWTIISAECDAGEYLAQGKTACEPCKVGNYCAGGTFSYDNNKDQGMDACSGATHYQDQTGQATCKTVSDGYYKKDNTAQTECGKNHYCKNGVRNQCPGGYTTDTTTASLESDCYKTCTVACTQQDCPKHATCTHGTTTTNGKQYVGSVCDAAASTCDITINCNNGYDLNGTECMVQGYTITYYDGKTVLNGLYPTAYSVESDTITLPTSSKTGYTFGGWYDNEDLTGTAVTQIATGSTGNKTFWAKWTIISAECDAGEYLAQGKTACEPCKVGNYCAGGTFSYDNTKDQGMDACSGAAQYQDQTGQATCKTVNDGYVANDEHTAQTECGKNYYCKNGVRTQCPDAGETSTETTSLITDCFKVGLPCEIDGASGTNTCKYDENKKSYSDCPPCNIGVCNSGYYKDNNICVVCPVGSYCPGDNKAYGCPSDSRTVTSPESSSAATSCYVTCPTKTVSNGTVATVNSTIKYNGSAYPACTYKATCNAGYTVAQNNTTNPTCNINTYTIKYELDDGENAKSNPSSYTIESDTITLEAPSKDGYTFGGWYSDNNEQITQITKGSTGDITLYAKWTIISDECDAGEYLAQGKTACEPCKVGNYCAGGTFSYDNNKDQGMDACSGATQYQDQTGQATCKTVSDGYYKKDNTAQTECGKNYYCKNGVRNQCPGGYTTDTTTASLESDCYKTCTVACTQQDCPKHATCTHGTTTTTGKQYVGSVCDAAASTCDITINCDNGYDLNGTECMVQGYTITYYDGKTVLNGLYPTAYSVESDTITLPTSSKDGYTFGGWYDNSELTGTAIKTIATGSTGNKTFWVKWQECGINSYCPGDNKSYECPDDGQTKTTTAKSVTECYKSGLSCSTTGGTGTRICDYNKETKLYNTNCTECNITTCFAGLYMDDNKCETCPAGSYCPGDNKAYECPLGTTCNAGANTKEQCYMDCAEKTVIDGIAYPDTETIFWPNTCEYSFGTSNNGNPCEIIDNVCIEIACEYDYEMINGKCQPCNRKYALSYKQTGNCEIDTCEWGYYPLGQQCIEAVRDCPLPENAIAAQQSYDPAIDNFGECTILECAYGYHLSDNTCVPNMRTCELPNGTGIQSWNEKLHAWEPCIATKCAPGYTTDPNLTNERWEQCGTCNNMYDINGDIAVSQYTYECEIATCMFHGKKYLLENNECRLICDERTDETGRRFWNGKECIHECNPGFTQWENTM